MNLSIFNELPFYLEVRRESVGCIENQNFVVKSFVYLDAHLEYRKLLE